MDIKLETQNMFYLCVKWTSRRTVIHFYSVKKAVLVYDHIFNNMRHIYRHNT